MQRVMCYNTEGALFQRNAGKDNDGHISSSSFDAIYNDRGDGSRARAHIFELEEQVSRGTVPFLRLCSRKRCRLYGSHDRGNRDRGSFRPEVFISRKILHSLCTSFVYPLFLREDDKKNEDNDVRTFSASCLHLYRSTYVGTSRDLLS